MAAPGRLRRESALPHFLVIGAMKAGTTTLYRDMLASMPEVFLPLDKEPDALVDDQVLTPAGRHHYARLFASARSGQFLGEASTAYTKRPDFEGVARRAWSLLGSDLKLIYLIRHPIQRIISQIQHELTLGWQLPEPATAVRLEPRFVAYSSYAYQLDPWIATFGQEALLVLSFEDYIIDRTATLERVAAFLGIDFQPDLVAKQRVYNQTRGKPIFTKRWERFQRSAMYNRLIRPRLSAKSRERLRYALLPKARIDPIEFDAYTRFYLAKRLAPDVARLRVLLGSEMPLWELEEENA